MNHHNLSGRNGFDCHPIRVQAPHSYDGIGQALRSAYRDHRRPHDAIATALHRLETVD